VSGHLCGAVRANPDWEVWSAVVSGAPFAVARTVHATTYVAKRDVTPRPSYGWPVRGDRPALAHRPPRASTGHAEPPTSHRSVTMQYMKIATRTLGAASSIHEHSDSRADGVVGRRHLGPHRDPRRSPSADVGFVVRGQFGSTPARGEGRQDGSRWSTIWSRLPIIEYVRPTMTRFARSSPITVSSP